MSGRQGRSPVPLSEPYPLLYRWQQPWQRRQRPVTGEGGERPTTVLLPAVATVGCRGGGGRWYRSQNRTRC